MTGSILVTGGTGFLGRALLRRLVETEKRPLIAAVRSRRAQFPAKIKIELVGELASNTDWSGCLQGVEVVIHCAARAHVMEDGIVNPLAEYLKVNAKGTLALARQAAQAGTRRFVFISSIKVNGELTAFGQPFCPTDVPAPAGAYGASKLEAEQGLMALARETSMEVVIIRPPLVYGPGVRGNFASMVCWVRKCVPLPLAAVNNQRSFVALENLVDFVALCANRERSLRAANEVFLISDGEDVSTSDLLRKVASAYGTTPRLIPVPAIWIQRAASFLGKRAVADRLVGSLVVDSSKARHLLGWVPVISMDEQLQKMALHDSLV